MNDYTWVSQVSALLVILAGVVLCFWGYRILKITLALIGFIAGAYGGWEFGISFIHSSTGIALLCALVAGLVGVGLCLWLYFVGIFLVGAAAGLIVAAACVSGSGQQIPSIVFVIVSVVFGAIALLAQKLMIIISTAFGGSYLILAGCWPFVAEHESASRIWLHPAQSSPPGAWEFAALVIWIVLAFMGAAFQFRAGRPKPEPAAQKT